MFNRLLKLFLAFMITAALSTECTSGGTELKIYAVCYGRSTFQNRFVFYGDKSGGKVPFSWMFYYIQYGSKKILIDTGFNDPGMVKTFGITDFKDPVSILLDNGIDPDQITDVIITHSHFDHIGNAPHFKNAQFIMNKDEFAVLNKNRNLNDVKRFLNSSSKVTLFDDNTLLYNMFSVRKAGGHTIGSSAVFFTFKDIEYCFTGDEIYLQENISENIGNGSVVSHKNNMAFIDLLRKSDIRLFIFHDSRYADLKERFIKVFPSE